MPKSDRAWKVWVERSGKNWRCRWSGCHGTGQHVFVFKDDATELAIAKKRAFARADAGLPPLPDSTPGARPDFDAFAASYLKWLKHRRAPATAANAARSLRFWIEFAGHDFPVLKKDQERLRAGRTVAEFSDWLMERPARHAVPGERANGVRILLRHLKAALRWAHREEIIPYDPFLHFEFPAAVKVARMVTKDQAIAVLRELPDAVRRAVYFNLHAGLRISELVRLDWSGIEVVPDPKGGEKWYLTVVKSKTRRVKKEETKTIAIHPNAIASMGPRRPAGPVFSVKYAWLQTRLRRAVVKLGLGRLRWHDLRHTWATNLMDDVRDLRGVMDAGGWATVEAAMVYQHGTGRRRDAALEGRSEISPDEATGGKK